MSPREPDELPHSVQQFQAWMMRYVREHNLHNGCTPKQWQEQHRVHWEAAAQEFGLTLHTDGALTVNKSN